MIKHLLGRDLWISPEVDVGAEVLGSEYGGWGLSLRELGPGSVVYSFGIGEDASFDLALIEAKGCRVHGFDPTPKSLRWAETHVAEARFIMHPWALGGEEGELELWLPPNPEHVSATCRPAEGSRSGSFKARCHTLESVMTELGHERVDVLKMDIEGAEYPVIESICLTRMIENVDQLMIEFHHWMKPFGREDTRRALALLRKEGYRIGWVSRSGHEVLFVRRSG